MAVNKYVFLILLWFTTLTPVLSQRSSLLEANVDDFPQVEIDFSYRSPHLLDTTKIKLLENGKSFDTFNLKEKKTNNSITSKQVLILIENSHWQRFDSQLESVKLLWSEIAGEVIDKNDEIFVATFDWTKGSQTIHLLNEKGTSSPSQINDLIQSISKPDNDGRQHKSTEIYPALIESVSFLNNLNKKDSVAQAILLFSSEFNNIYNNTQTKTDVIISARNSGISIYAYRYAYSNKYDLKDIAQNTYGVQLNMQESTNQDVIKSINEIQERYAGKNYTLKFESSISANNDFRDVEIVISDEDSINLRYQSPDMWSIIWKNLNYRYGIIGGGLILIVLVFFLIYQLKKRRDKQLEQIQNIQHETENAIQQSELNRAEENRLKEKKDEDLKVSKFEEELQIHFNRIPRPAQLISSKGEEIEILKPVFYIGRRSENDMSFDNSTVSKVHAIIYYDHIPGTLQLLNEKRYIIVDFDSTNATYVNGQLVASISEIKSGASPKYLNNSDVIQMGEVSITFMD